ncbi:glycoprotein 3-alpha-L-fucosyltransferase A isoform X2 [Hyalella azteca]|uniref:Fucosyltransferase n=1 Tax=Hyalella azteca TaxID=294128 RepID=A0A979FX03_HYAAZ|nr:glycoprotein 3-alpha-L-fucosyltransferase A isoform X2 [Hyalella azteca]
MTKWLWRGMFISTVTIFYIFIRYQTGVSLLSFQGGVSFLDEVLSSSGIVFASDGGTTIYTAGNITFPFSGYSAIAVDNNATVYAYNNITLAYTGSLPLQEKATWDLAVQKESFVGKFVLCDDQRKNGPVRSSCSLRLTVNSIANSSLDFDYIHRRLETRWDDGFEQPEKNGSNGKIKNILEWSERHPTRTQHGDQQYFSKCPVNNCQITANRTLVQPDEVDAIILNSMRMPKRSKNSPFPDRRSYPNAKFVLQSSEAPDRVPVSDAQVDYTLGYRRDSDIVATNIIVHLKPEPTHPKHGHLSSTKTYDKRRMAAWFVSNCRSTPSNRMRLAQSLQKYGLQVDIYGKCGKLQCGPWPTRAAECYRMVEQHYKFYFSFENSLCNHYVTEKIFNLLRYDVIPVTYGLGHELTGAPKDAYIDVFDFPDVQSLAAYLLYLDSNTTAYNEYFRWKQFYEVNSFLAAGSLCKLCEILVRGIEPEREYTSMEAWSNEGQCINVDENRRLSDFIEGKPVTSVFSSP